MIEMLEARQNGVLVFSLKGRLDAASTLSLRNLLQQRIAQSGRRLAVAAAGLTYISSAGLGPSAASGKAARRALRTNGAVRSPGARKACFGNRRFHIAVQHIQFMGGSRSGLPARLTYF